MEAALPVIWAFVWMLPPPSLSAKVTVALACPCPPASRDLIVSTARWSASSFSVTSTVPVNFIDIAPIFTRISAFTASGPVVSSTLPPWTAGTTRSRSVMAAKLSSIGFVVVNEWSSSTAMGGLLSAVRGPRV